MLLLLALASFLLMAVSVTEVALVSTMVSFLHEQKWFTKTYTINWPDQAVTMLCLPKGLEVNQGHATNGAAGYGFVLGVLGLIVAWRAPKAQRRSKLLTLYVSGLILAVVYTIAPLAYVFIVTNQTNGQKILESGTKQLVGDHYPIDSWTPENWYKALLNVPLADDSLRGSFKSHIKLMEAWKWMIIPLWFIMILTCAVAVMEWMKAAKRSVGTGFQPVEKSDRYETPTPA